MKSLGDAGLSGGQRRARQRGFANGQIKREARTTGAVKPHFAKS